MDSEIRDLERQVKCLQDSLDKGFGVGIAVLENSLKGFRLFIPLGEDWPTRDSAESMGAILSYHLQQPIITAIETLQSLISLRKKQASSSAEQPLG